MNIRRSRLAVGTILATLALAGAAACSSPNQPAPGPAPGAPPPASDPAAAPGAGQATDAQRAALGQAHQGALALVALGGLGAQQGASEQVRTLGPQLQEQGQSLDQQIRSAANAQGVALGDQLSAQQQSMLADLQSRTGQPFDQAWLRAALDMQQQARDAANAVLNDPNATPEAEAAAQRTLAQLDALLAQLRQAAGEAGSATPGSVNAGTGGQAATQTAPIGAIGLIGLGAVLLGGVGWWWCRRRA
ncbi:DUF4142 domain-containing protein [Pseudonocardia asaccharolytica]|uniref:DUF4142 domain-containing protein n=1 Tax=Pseudonocardia asaccharolytica DSM 44247 = NBRC 16224 TaxID=1123024 RepID=A0A511D5K5_9PSEU|nr:DUF4142 domain-containing protein [Pseudonocardia asaccharolytica]GEL19733.1 hypothetical protein PA7_35700 [Pseudonocardia asaccharolytica DSM 44247 = NBRC 16224]